MNDMKDTKTYKDILEIPALLRKFDEINSSLPSFLKKNDEFFLIGRGSSGNATLFAKYIWESYCGKISNIVHPFSIFNLKKNFNMKGRTVFSFSQSGRSYDVVECTKRLKKMGANIVAVTNEPNLKKNTLASISDFHILLSNSPEIPVAATKSFLLQLWAILRISNFLGSGFPQTRFKKSIEEIEWVIKNFERIIKLDTEMLIRSRVVGFIGRGPFNAICEDAALKFREMAQLQTLAYSAAEFLHGPIGAFTKRDYVVILSRGKKLTDDLKLVSDKLSIRKVCWCAVKPFSDNYPFNTLAVDVFMKLVALYVSVKKGLNPDNPVGLSKITYTF
ncbi:MAG: SIS domain-containing protein [Elusimicrobiales bacterium]